MPQNVESMKGTEKTTFYKVIVCLGELATKILNRTVKLHQRKKNLFFFLLFFYTRIHISCPYQAIFIAFLRRQAYQSDINIHTHTHTYTLAHTIRDQILPSLHSNKKCDGWVEKEYSRHARALCFFFRPEIRSFCFSFAFSFSPIVINRGKFTTHMKPSIIIIMIMIPDYGLYSNWILNRTTARSHRLFFFLFHFIIHTFLLLSSHSFRLTPHEFARFCVCVVMYT